MPNNTGNPVPSISELDFEDNCENLDKAMSSNDLQFTDRLGVDRYTWHGLTELVEIAAGRANNAKGWSPVFGIETNGEKNALKLVSYSGGTGDVPTNNIGRYLGPAGYVTNINSAVDVRGVKGDLGNKGWTPQFSLVANGEKVVQRLVSWVGGEGTAPTQYVGYYVGTTGYVSNINDGIDVRGPKGVDALPVRYVDTRPEGVTLATSLPTGSTVWIDSDATYGGVRTRNTVASGALTSPVADDAGRIQAAHINAPAYLKTVSDLLNGVPVDIMVAIPNDLKSGIRAGTSTSDVSAHIKAFFADTSVPEGADIKFNEGLYSIDAEVVLARNLNIEFARGTISGKGARLITRANTRGFVCRGTSGSRMATPRLSGIYVGSSFTGHSQDLIALEYLFSGSVDHLTANAISTGAGISFKECWDMSVVRPFTRGCGTPYNYTAPTGNERGQLHFYSPAADNNNNIKVWHPHMEWDGGNFGAHIIIDPNVGLQANNQISFYGIKAELNQGNNFVQNIIRGGERLDFEGTWSLYDRCFRITGGKAININGHVYNNTPAAGYFASIEAGENITGLITGVNIGAVTRTGLAARDTLRTQQMTTDADWPDLATSIEALSGRRYLGNTYRKFTAGHALEASSGTFLASKISVTAQDFATIIQIPLSSRSYFKDGLTLWAKLSCAAGTQDVTGYSNFTGGSDTALGTRTVTTTPTWYRFAIPPNAADQVGAFAKLATNSMAGGKVTLHEFFVKDQLESPAPPGIGTWEAGAVTRNPSVAVNAPVVEWVCVIAGTPGTWRPKSWHTRANTTANRPALTGSDIGVQYLDTTLAAAGKLITWNGTAWVDGTGNIV